MKKLESGRSMVEMLGVLAIIGVLSIGGIAGYVLSMNRYRANAVLDAANKYASLAYSSYQTFIAQGNDSSDWKGLSFSSTKLSVPESAGVTLGKGTGEGAVTGASAISTDGKVTVTMAFPNKDICETAAGILGLEAITSGTAGAGQVTCAEAASEDDNGNKPASFSHEFAQN